MNSKEIVSKAKQSLKEFWIMKNMPILLKMINI